MSGDKEKMDVLVQKIDDLLLVLKSVSEDLKTVSSSLKSMAVSQITSSPQTSSASRPAASAPVARPTAPPTPAPATAASQGLDEIRMMFSQDLDNLLIFEDKGEYVMIKPKQFLGSENFAKIASTVRGVGGEYISAGRDSHFRVYKKKA
jgi:BRCT domain type II-containing protein